MTEEKILGGIIDAITSNESEEPAIDCLRDCPDLGHCCRKFCVIGFTRWQPLDKRRSAKGVQRFLNKRRLGIFKPHSIRDDGSWMITCPKLGADGRCSDYDNRPELCRSFRPGCGDGLCLIRPAVDQGAEKLKDQH